MTPRPPASGSHHARGVPAVPDLTRSRRGEHRSERAWRDSTSAIPGARDQQPADDRHYRHGRSPTRRARLRSRRPVPDTRLAPSPSRVSTSEVAHADFFCRYPRTSTQIRAHPIMCRSDLIVRRACVSGRSARSRPSLHTREVAGSRNLKLARVPSGCPIRALDQPAREKPGSGSLATGQAPGPIARRAALRAALALPRRRRSGRAGRRGTARRCRSTTMGVLRRSTAATRARREWRR
jgi:hypothetical protein